MKNVTQQEWRALLVNDDNAVIIDCRTPNEWRSGVLENSILIDISNPYAFMDKANTLDQEKNYYVYCRSGMRSIQACQILEHIGIKTAYNLLGGILNWNGKIVVPKI
jgi:rhodanese-related sulfurtransferase